MTLRFRPRSPSPRRSLDVVSSPRLRQASPRRRSISHRQTRDLSSEPSLFRLGKGSSHLSKGPSCLGKPKTVL